MNTIRMEFEMPSEILNYVSTNDSNYSNKVKELMVYALVKEGKIPLARALKC